METYIPTEAAAAIEVGRRKEKRRRSQYRVRAADGLYPVIEMDKTGFVIEAAEPPHMRGFVDLLEGEERVTRRLVVCVWARDGLVGYEFKRESGVGHVPADHVAPAHAGLLEPPRT